ncbi:MAG: hypothetical protein IJ466_07095 [Clostridia bacterium]|nr:hypothetical protein [Clostridia bacterium]
MEMIRDKMDVLFEELVPPSGKCDSLAGEIIRAASRIGYRFFNDGDQLGIGYGKETCNAAGRFLIKRTNEKIADIVSDMFGLYSEEKYENKLKDMLDAVVEHVEENPELRKTETDDMFDYRDEFEDVDDSEEEDWY